jgi:ketosteroid isomerase-like protein
VTKSHNKTNLFDDKQKEVVTSEVKAEFSKFVDILNQKDVAKWSEFYSDENFVSAIAGVAYFQTKKEWVEAINNFFSQRLSQKLTVANLNIKPLSPENALVICEDNTEFVLQDSTLVKSKHFFTMIWHKEQAGWKIIHSHESWADAIEN